MSPDRARRTIATSITNHKNILVSIGATWIVGPCFQFEIRQWYRRADHLINLGRLWNIGQRPNQYHNFVWRDQRLSDTGKHTECKHIDFQKASASMSSLFHSMFVLFSILALSNGHRSEIFPSVITNPPVCCPNWRGKPMYAEVSCNTFCMVVSSG